jgi:hypothetical protein
MDCWLLAAATVNFKEVTQARDVFLPDILFVALPGNCGREQVMSCARPRKELEKGSCFWSCGPLTVAQNWWAHTSPALDTCPPFKPPFFSFFQFCSGVDLVLNGDVLWACRHCVSQTVWVLGLSKALEPYSFVLSSALSC